eukprot:3938722-Rhodomonas_salina.3
MRAARAIAIRVVARPSLALRRRPLDPNLLVHLAVEVGRGALAVHAVGLRTCARLAWELELPPTVVAPAQPCARRAHSAAMVRGDR